MRLEEASETGSQIKGELSSKSEWGVLSTWERGRKDGKTFGGSTGNRLTNSGGVKAGNKRIGEV